ncbi:hypothetical protein ACSBR1_018490 [Camellia fascicularis]
MADNVPHDGAPFEVPPPLSPHVKVEEPVVAKAGKAVEGIGADFAAEFAPRLEPEPQPLRVRPFDPMTYHPHTYILAVGGLTRFDDFASGMLEDVLLREPHSHLSYSAFEVQTLFSCFLAFHLTVFLTVTWDSRSYRGYGAVTARDWYYELPSKVCNLVDEAGFGLFCTELS